MNEETEELDDNLVNIKGDVYDLTGGKVSIMLDPNTYKTPYEILDSIAEVWDELTDKNRAQLLEKLFGKTRVQIGAAIIENFAQARKAMETMSESAGAADREMDIITNSLEYKINNLKETFTGIWQNIFNRKDMGGLLDGIQPFINGIETITSQIGLLGTAVATAGIAVGIKGIVSAFQSFNAAAGTTSLIRSLANAFPGLASSVTAFTTALQASGNVFAAFGEGIVALAAAHPFLTLTAGAIALGLVLDKIITTGSEANKKMEDSLESYENAKQKVVDINTELSNVQESINTLETKSSLTFVEEAELSKLREAADLLRTQADLAEKEEQRAAKQLAKDSYEAFKKNFKNPLTEDMYNQYIDEFANGRSMLSFTGGDASDIPLMLAGIEQAKTMRDMYQVGSDDWEYFNGLIGDGTDAVWDQVTALTGYKEALQTVPYQELTKSQKEALDTIDSAIELAYQHLDPEKWNQMQFDKIFDHSKNKQTYDDLLGIALASDNIGVTIDDVNKALGQNKELADDLKNSGFTAEDLMNNINSEAEILDVHKVKENVKNKVDEEVEDATDDIDDSTTTVEPEVDIEPKVTVRNDEAENQAFDEWVDGLDDKTALALNKLFGDSSVDTSNWSLKDFQTWADTFTSGSESASESAVDLAGDLSDLQYAFGEAGANLSNYVTDYKSQMNSLTTARDKWNKGELTTEDMVALQSEFYNLNDFDLSNFGDGIQKQMETITGSFATTADSYKDFRKELSNDTALKKALDAFGSGEQLRKGLEGALGDEKEAQAHALIDAAQEYGLVQKDSTDSVNDFTDALYSETKAAKKATGIIGKFDDAIELVGGETTDAGRALIRMRDNLIGLYDVTGDSATAYDHLKTQLSTFSDYQTVANNALKSSRSATGLTTDEVEKLTAAYRNVKGFNPAKLFEQTANGIHLNQQEFKRLNEEVKKNTLTDMYTDLLAKQSQLDALRASGGDTSALEADIQNAQLLIAQYEGLTSAYNAWITAKSNGNERDSYESLGKSAYDDMKKIMDAGWKGDESLNSYLDLMLSASQRTNDVYADFAKLDQKIEGTSHSLMDYWQYDGDGSLVVDGLANFLKDVNSVMGDEYVSMGEDGMFGIDFTGEKLQEVADRFGMSTELLELFGRAMIDAGMNVDFTDQKLVDTSNTLKELQDQGVISPEIDTSGISSVNETVEEAHATLDSLTAEKKRLELEADVNTDAIDALDVAIEAESSKVITMEIEAQLAGGATIEEMIGWTDEEIMANLHVDSSQVDEARAKLEELGGETETTTITVQLEEGQFEELTSKEGTVKLKPEVEGEVEDQHGTVLLKPEVEGEVEDQNGNVNLHVGVVDPVPDQDANVNYHTGSVDPIPEQTATVKYRNSTTKVNNQNASINYSTGSVAPVPDQTATVNYNTGSVEPVPDQEATANYHVNIPEEATFPDKDANVTYHVNKEPEPEYPDQNPAVNYGINAPSAPVYPNQYPTVSYRLSAPAAPSYPNMSRTITYTIRTVGSAPSGTKHADGTMTSLTRAHASGTAYNVANYKNAYADGKIALDSDEIALVNELGTESIIRDGKWMLLPQGMHQEYLKKGDIVLSAKQTQALINTGAALGHGRAYAFGTLSNAYYTGSGTIGRPNQTSTTGGGGGTSTGGSGTGGGGGGSSTGGGGGGNTTQQTTPAADTSTEQPEEPEWFDWIELKLDRIERKVEKLKKLSEDTFRSWTNRAKSLKDQISATTEELNTQQQAYNRYMQQANSVGLSDDLKKAVQEGRIDINQYDENTQKLIEDYQKWYYKCPSIWQQVEVSI